MDYKQINEQKMIDLKTLNEVELELQRFKKKLAAAQKRVKEETRDGEFYMSTKEVGAVKRAALDLKLELTKITNP